MKISANSIKPGNILVHNNELWTVTKMPEHTKPGKGPAYVQVEMKSLKNGTKLNTRFSSSDDVERVQLDQRDCEFLYPEDDHFIFMDVATFEQITLDKKIIGDKLPFLKDNMIVKLEFYEESVISIQLQSTIIAEIAETDPVIKGATATSSYKQAILDNGVRVLVPPYLVVGEKIVVKTEDASFVERAK